MVFEDFLERLALTGVRFDLLVRREIAGPPASEEGVE